MKTKHNKITAALVASALMFSSVGAHAQTQQGGALSQRLNMEGVIKTIQQNTQYKEEYQQHGCSKEAWTVLQKQQLGALKEYQVKQSPSDVAILNAGAIMPSTLGLNGCLSGVSDVLKKYKTMATDITKAIEGFDGSISGLMGNLFNGILKRVVDKATDAACNYVNGKIADAEQALLNKSGLGGVLSSGQAALSNPFGTFEKAVYNQVDKAMDNALGKALDKN